MIQIKGLNQIGTFVRELDLAFAAMDRQLSQSFDDWTKKVHRQLVETTPQFTGDLASAWNYSVKTPDYSYTPSPTKLANDAWSPYNTFMPYERGAEPAVSVALAKAAGVHPTWRDVVYLTNPAEIAEQVERHMIILRPVNLIDGRVAMVQYYVDKFNRGELGP